MNKNPKLSDNQTKFYKNFIMFTFENTNYFVFYYFSYHNIVQSVEIGSETVLFTKLIFYDWTNTYRLNVNSN